MIAKYMLCESLEQGRGRIVDASLQRSEIELHLDLVRHRGKASLASGLLQILEYQM